MARFRITCVVRDENGVIQQVGLDNGEVRQVGDIINWIDNHIHEIFSTTPSGRFEVPVYVSHPPMGIAFITTNRDGIPPNNLDLLPSCYQDER